MTLCGQGGVEGAGRQRAVKEVVVRAQVVDLCGGGTRQAEVWVVGSETSAAGDAGAGGRLLSS